MTNPNPNPNPNPTRVVVRYDIVDDRTGRVVGTARTRRAASRSVDRRDSAYGACRYYVRTVYADE